jgi:hypothetical protein
MYLYSFIVFWYKFIYFLYVYILLISQSTIYTHLTDFFLHNSHYFLYILLLHDSLIHLFSPSLSSFIISPSCYMSVGGSSSKTNHSFSKNSRGIYEGLVNWIWCSQVNFCGKKIFLSLWFKNDIVGCRFFFSSTVCNHFLFINVVKWVMWP